MSEKKSVWAGVLLESVMIIFSVFIALFINEWRNDNNETKRTALIVQNVESEIQKNREIIKSTIEYHRDVMNRLGQLGGKEVIEQKFSNNFHLILRDIAPRGILQEQLQDIAWAVAKEDKITNRIPLDESRALFAVYEQQSLVKGTFEKMIGFVSSREAHRKELIDENVMVLNMLMNELIGQEKVLESKCSGALEIIKKRGKNN